MKSNLAAFAVLALVCLLAAAALFAVGLNVIGVAILFAPPAIVLSLLGQSRELQIMQRLTPQEKVALAALSKENVGPMVKIALPIIVTASIGAVAFSEADLGFCREHQWEALVYVLGIAAITAVILTPLRRKYRRALQEFLATTEYGREVGYPSGDGSSSVLKG